jgi:hypothetical protein
MTENDPKRVHRLLNSEEETYEGITPAKYHAGPPHVYKEPLSRPALDANDMPLPRRVDEIDVGGTRRVGTPLLHLPLMRAARWGVWPTA